MTGSPVGAWTGWADLDRPVPLGDDRSYIAAADWTADCTQVEDWGCGPGWLSRFVNHGYIGVDASPSPFANVVRDLAEPSHTAPAGLVMRHVLEHNYRWPEVLDNAVAAFGRRLCIVVFTPLCDRTHVLHTEPDYAGVPVISFCLDDLVDRIVPFVDELTVERFTSATFYGSETVIRARRGPHPAPVVYTAIAGDYDRLRPHRRNDMRWLAFLDDIPSDTRGWEVVPLSLAASPRRRAKLPKVLCHQALPGVARSLWVDGHVEITDAEWPRRCLELASLGQGVAVFRHPSRDNIYDEARESIRLGIEVAGFDKYRDEPMADQVASYRVTGFPDGFGLWACGQIARVHSPAVAALNERWWAEIERWGVQDQLSFPVACWASAITPTDLPGHCADHRSFSLLEHADGTR